MGTVTLNVPDEVLEKAELYGIDLEEYVTDPVYRYEESVDEDTPLHDVVAIFKALPEPDRGGTLKRCGLQFQVWAGDLIKVTLKPHNVPDKNGRVSRKGFMELMDCGWITCEALREYAYQLVKACDVFEKLKLSRTCETHLYWNRPSGDP